MSVKRASMTPPPDTLQHETVRAIHGAYEDLMQQALRTIATLRKHGAQNHADALAANAMKLARKGRLHMRQLAAQARREQAANTNREHAA
jgi:hypothetical protein